MIILETPSAMRAWARGHRRAGATIGFVPTMGALHEGHLSLARAAARDNDLSVASVFVNPTQFAPHEDFGHYPRTFGQDLALLESACTDAVYAPAGESMYPEGYGTYVQVNGVTDGLCGARRPHFFRGVTTVVTKLFNAVLPDRAYFGRKDAQQCVVIRHMARDLDMGIEIVAMPIVRERDGLAMSSRNRYLSPEERRRALCLSHSLVRAGAALESGERETRLILGMVRDGMCEVEVDYAEIVDADDLKPVDRIERPIILAIAAILPSARLIDNLCFDPLTGVAEI